jgi:hypothetical protein
VRLERGALSLVSTSEELLGTKSSGSDLEIREYDRKDPLALTSPASGVRSVGILRARTQAKECFSFIHPLFILIFMSHSTIQYQSWNLCNVGLTKLSVRTCVSVASTDRSEYKIWSRVTEACIHKFMFYSPSRSGWDAFLCVPVICTCVEEFYYMSHMLHTNLLSIYCSLTIQTPFVTIRDRIQASLLHYRTINRNLSSYYAT